MILHENKSTAVFQKGNFLVNQIHWYGNCINNNCLGIRTITEFTRRVPSLNIHCAYNDRPWTLLAKTFGIKNILKQNSMK